MKKIIKVVCALAASVTLFTNVKLVQAKENHIRIAPVVYYGVSGNYAHFSDYTVKDWEKDFVESVKGKGFTTLQKKGFNFYGKYHVAYFKNEIDLYKIHLGKIRTIVKHGGVWYYESSGKAVKLTTLQKKDLKNWDREKVLIDTVNGKKVLMNYGKKSVQ